MIFHDDKETIDWFIVRVDPILSAATPRICHIDWPNNLPVWRPASYPGLTHWPLGDLNKILDK